MDEDLKLNERARKNGVFFLFGLDAYVEVKPKLYHELKVIRATLLSSFNYSFDYWKTKPLPKSSSEQNYEL